MCGFVSFLTLEPVANSLRRMTESCWNFACIRWLHSVRVQCTPTLQFVVEWQQQRRHQHTSERKKEREKGKHFSRYTVPLSRISLWLCVRNTLGHVFISFPLLTFGSNCAQVVSRDMAAHTQTHSSNAGKAKIPDKWNMKQGAQQQQHQQQ